MNELGDLLEQWAKLEPGWCELRVGGSYWVGKITVDGDSVAYRAHPPFTEPHSSMRIQFAVQQAIVARGWRFGIQHYSADFQVWVSAPNRRYCWSNADSPATALLSAYVKELDEVAKKGQGQDVR